MDVLSPDRYHAALATDIERFADVVAGADLGVTVPTCPQWSLAQLAAHTGAAHRWVSAIVAERATGPVAEPVPDAPTESAAPLPVTANQESAELRWLTEPEVARLRLHPAFAASWPALRSRDVVLVVDAANVVGSVPDGWWRDRAGAAERLLHRLARALPRTLALPDGYGWVRRCVVVLEGRGAAAPDVAAVDVVRAPGSGDDTIVSVAEPGAVVVTADRGLRARLPAGVTTLGPATLLALLR